MKNSVGHGYWSFVLDYKLIGVFFWITLVLPVLFFVLFYLQNHWFTPFITPPGLLRTNLFYFYDVIAPLSISFSMLLLLAPGLEKNSCPYLYSLPISRFKILLFRCFRLLIILLVPNLAVLYPIHLTINKEIAIAIPYVDYIFWTLPNVIFLCGLAIFLMTILKKLFYSAALIGGYFLLDVSSMGALFGEGTMFMSLSPIQYTPDALQINRGLYLLVGILFIIVSYPIYYSKFYRSRL